MTCIINPCKDHHRIRISQAELHRFWMHWRQYMPKHPAAENDPPVHTPIGISGDDTQFTLSGSKIIVMLVNFLLHEPGPGQLSRFPWFLLRHEWCLGPRTLDPAVRVLSWSLNICYGGHFPMRGPFSDVLSQARQTRAGRKISGGPFSLNEIRGDWKWHLELLRLSRHYSSNKMCCFCRATKSHGPNQFTAFERFSTFHRFTTAEFFLESLGSYISPLTWVAGFSPGLIALCSMHVSNLGLAQWTNAGILLGLLSRKFFGDPADLSLSQRLQICTVRFRRWCQVHSVMQTQPFLTAGMLHCGVGQTPELTLKAYHGRVFISYMASCCSVALRDQPDGQDQELILMLAASHNLSMWHQALESYPRFLSPAQADNLIMLSNRFLLAYRKLAEIHANKNSLAFPLRPKLHAFQEINFIAKQCLWNPRHRHCFKDEDCMGIVKHIARRVHRNLLEMRTLCRLLMLYKSKHTLVHEQVI